jgi:DNA replication and repair protein RecF
VRILRFQATGFRNLAPEVVDADAPVTVWWGGNGQGKTNLLEAVALLGALRSFRTGRLAECVTRGGSTAEIDAAVEAGGVVRRQAFRLGPGGRSLREDGRNVDALRWLRGLRAVWFAPTDTAVVTGEPALRRALMERACLTVAPAYLALGQHLRRVLDQRAAALRRGLDDETLSAIDAAFVDIARRVTAARAATVQAVAAGFTLAYAELSGGESAGVAYRPWLTPARGDFAGWLASHRAAEASADPNSTTSP